MSCLKQFFRISSGFHKSFESVLHDRFVLLVGHAEPGIVGSQHLDRRFALPDKRIGDERNVELALEFRSVRGWGSMMGFALYVMLEDEYGAKLTPEQFREFRSIADLMAVAGVKEENA